MTCAQWPQRETFLALIRKYLDATPRRPAYYPGTVERYRRFTQTHIDLDHQGCLPWSLIESQSVDAPNDSIHFQEESFTCVCVEKTISAEQLERFLPKAVAFCNEVLPGSLCASITIPPGMKILVNSSIGRTLDALRYGCVCVNQWSGLAYSLLTPGWGGFPEIGRAHV